MLAATCCLHLHLLCCKVGIEVILFNWANKLDNFENIKQCRKLNEETACGNSAFEATINEMFLELYKICKNSLIWFIS